MSAVNKAAEQGQEPTSLANEFRWSKHQQVVNAFFDHFHPDDTKDLLWSWLSAVLGADHPLYQNAKNRADLLFFYEQLEELLQAVYEWNKALKGPPDPM